MKLIDHESDTRATTRFDPQANPPAATAHRESWLNKLARHLGAAPVDHVMIPPAALAPERCGRSK
ncbi:MAG: hypothetical protein HYV96_20345 [Opitutae bacterium]|nr:hypothetical protein [Opitutae bacterium]